MLRKIPLFFRLFLRNFCRSYNLLRLPAARGLFCVFRRFLYSKIQKSPGIAKAVPGGKMGDVCYASLRVSSSFFRNDSLQRNAMLVDLVPSYTFGVAGRPVATQSQKTSISVM